MLDIPLGAKVECMDGECGKSTSIIVNPLGRKVTHFVLENDDFVGHKDRIVPVEKIADSTPKVIQLNCTIQDMVTMKPFTDTQYIHRDVAHYSGAYFGHEMYAYTEPYYFPDEGAISVDAESVPAGERNFHRGMVVEAKDGKVGEVDGLVVNPESEEITHLILQEGHLWGKKDVALPISSIDRVADDTVYLNLDKKTVEDLPAVPVRSDLDWDLGEAKQDD